MQKAFSINRIVTVAIANQLRVKKIVIYFCQFQRSGSALRKIAVFESVSTTHRNAYGYKNQDSAFMLNTNRYRSRRQNDYGSRFVKIAFGGMTRTVGFYQKCSFFLRIWIHTQMKIQKLARNLFLITGKERIDKDHNTLVRINIYIYIYMYIGTVYAYKTRWV